MDYLQINEKGENSIVKDFLDDLERLGIECKLHIESQLDNELTFTVIVRKSDTDIKKFKKLIRQKLIKGKI